MTTLTPTTSPLANSAATGDSDSFSALVRDHIDLVYAAALRQVRDPHLAEDVTQAVFIILARKADSLPPNIILAGWLINTTRFAARDALRSERRRKNHESKAAAMKTEIPPEPAPPTSPSLAPDLAPTLDAALATLSPKDRDALVLRYLQQQSLKSVSLALQTTEEAAGKRVSRALDKLHRYFQKTGFTLSAAPLADVLKLESTRTAPASLAATCTTAAHPAAASPALSIANGAMTMMKRAQLKFGTLLTAGTLAMLLIISAISFRTLAEPPPSPPTPAAAPAPPPASAPTAPEGFTPIVELTLAEQAPTAHHFIFINLNTQKQVTPPSALDADIKKWFVTGDVDLGLAPLPNDPAKRAVMNETARLRTLEGDFSALDPDLLRALFANPREIHVPLSISRDQLPALFAFKTKSGLYGAFQIVSYDDKQIVIRITTLAKQPAKP